MSFFVNLPGQSLLSQCEPKRGMYLLTYAPNEDQIRLRIRSETSVSAWRNFASFACQKAPSEDSDQTARMCRLIWIFAGRTYLKVRFLTFRLWRYVSWRCGSFLSLSVCQDSRDCQNMTSQVSLSRTVSNQPSNNYIDQTKYVASSENVLPDMRKMYGFTSSCTCAKSHPVTGSSLKHSIVSNDTFRTAKASMQPDLGFCCQHMIRRYTFAWWAKTMVILHMLNLAWMMWLFWYWSLYHRKNSNWPSLR